MVGAAVVGDSVVGESVVGGTVVGGAVLGGARRRGFCGRAVATAGGSRGPSVSSVAL